MLAARDQENLTYAHKHAAASKPLNQGLAPKTPGNKPFNQNLKGRFTGAPGTKGDENAPLGGKTGKTIKTKNAFVTPLAPRTDRAPLGAKTTNAKTKPFQTPAPLTVRPDPQKTALRGNTSARRPKLKIHQQSEPVPEADAVLKETLAEDSDSSLPSIEYCPPKITELDDVSSDEAEFWAQDFSGLKDLRTLAAVQRGLEEEIGEDGLTRGERQEKRANDEMERFEAEIDAKEAKRCEEVLRGWKTMEQLEEEGKADKARQNTQPSSRDAARALLTPSFAAPTAAAKARVSTAASTRTKKPPHLPSGPLPAGRGNASTAASRSTIGYAKGRKVSSTLHANRSSTGTEAQQDKSNEPLAEHKDLDTLLLENLLDQQEAELNANELDGMFDRLGMDREDAKDPLEEMFNKDYVL
ncbi:MAG: hypothetical protein M1828_000077 [Chrysothrix sp. TS-e1954]|nr:MAG: hypothetical protein M1828_000077 [Chrysothrix sp. TS-e1954]